MKHTIRITIAILVIGFAAACTHKRPEPPPTGGGKAYVPAGK